jgi:hypothetical protein
VTTLATESWTGTTGAAWPAGWTVGGTSGFSSSIQSNAGRLATPATSGAQVYAFMTGMASTASNTDVLVTFTLSSAAWLGISLSATNRSDFYPSDGYVLIVSTQDQALVVAKMLSNAVTYSSSVGKTITAGTQYKARFRRVAGTLTGRVWAAAGAEPGTWDITYTDAGTQPGAGKVQLALLNQTAAAINVTVDDLLVTDNGTPTSTGQTADVALSGTGTLTGSIVPKNTVSGALSGTSALTATVVPRATRSAALSALGTLSGAVTPKLTLSAALSGLGALTAGMQYGAPVAAALSGIGTLTASTRITVDAIYGSNGVLTAELIARQRYVFRPPTTEVAFRMAGRGLIGSYEQGLSVYRVGGQWLTKLSPTADDLAAADRYYAGGYVHPLDGPAISELLEAGFSDHIFPEEVPA